MLAKRIIVCLDVDQDLVVKGQQFRDHKVVGDIEALAQRYVGEGADELVFYDISASADGISARTAWVGRLARYLDIPFCVGGGIDSLQVAERILEAGADKISLNSPALQRPKLIDELAKTLGSQCVVVGVDSRCEDGVFRPWTKTGRVATAAATSRDTLGWIREAQARGAGEIVLNCMDHDGMRRGFDLEHLAAARAVCSVPLIASGGAGSPADFYAAFAAGVDGALGAGAFHSGALSVAEVKSYLAARGLAVRAETNLETGP